MQTTVRRALIDTDSVALQIGAPSLRLLEVDEDTTAYAKGHIPGSIGVHWKNDLQDSVRRDFIGAEAFAALMNRLGIRNDTQVILYGGNNNWFAAYAYWYFKYYAHESVRLMDGGRKKWELEGRPLTTDPATISPTSGYQTEEPRHEIRALRGYVEHEVLGQPGFG